MMYALADKYGMSGLKHIAIRKFDKTYNHEVHEKMTDPEKAGGIIPVISFVYSSTSKSDRSLRDLVSTSIWDLWPEIRDLPEFEVLISEQPQFMIDVINERMN